MGNWRGGQTGSTRNLAVPASERLSRISDNLEPKRRKSEADLQRKTGARSLAAVGNSQALSGLENQIDWLNLKSLRTTGANLCLLGTFISPWETTTCFEAKNFRRAKPRVLTLMMLARQYPSMLPARWRRQGQAIMVSFTVV